MRSFGVAAAPGSVSLPAMLRSPHSSFAGCAALQFKRKCLRRLVEFMMENDNCTGCTGRQRVMTAEQQGNDVSDCQPFCCSRALRGWRFSRFVPGVLLQNENSCSMDRVLRQAQGCGELLG